MAEKNTSNGKGSDPRNCMSDSFKENFDLIKWDTKIGNKKDMKNKIDSDLPLPAIRMSYFR